ncbi:MAG: NADP-dependent oxidoreductase [Burkholderiaceae bacterium]
MSPQTPERMQAVRIDRFGGPEVMQLVDLPVPRPGDGELLVRIGAASLNPVDWKIREGRYPVVKEDRLPYMLGRDYAGVVVGCGAGADFSEGDAVHGLLDPAHGSFAEYVVVRGDEVAARPASLDAVAAAALPLAGLTAWQGLFTHGRLAAGQRVLVHAGSGGVGHLAVQFAKARGAEVVATASGPHVEFVRSRGADLVIDYRKQRFEEVAGEVDLVYDLLGGETQARSWAVLRRGGALVSTLQEPSQDEADRRGVRALRYTAQPSRADLREIAALVDAGRVRPHVSAVSPLRDARSALQAVEEGHTLGKAVLVMDRA